VSWYTEHATEVNALCVGVALGVCASTFIVRREIRRTGALYVEAANRVYACATELMAMADRRLRGEHVPAEDVEAANKLASEAIRKVVKT
jgi:hypothetical protein